MSLRKTKTIHEDSYRLLLHRLRAARKKAKVTQLDLAKRLGKDQSYVSKYERSERRLDVIELLAICSALRMDFLGFMSQFLRELAKKEG